MKNNRSRFGVKRNRGTKRSRPTSTIAKRLYLMSGEQLEYRMLLSGSSLMGRSAFLGDASSRSMLASMCAPGQSSAPAATSSALSTETFIAAAAAPQAAPQTADAPPIASPLQQTTGELVGYTVSIVDMGNNPVANNILNVGQGYQLQVEVQDIRDPANSIPGVYAAYVNVSFDTTKISISPTATPSFGTSFAPYSTVVGQGGASFSLVNGQVESTGSFGTSVFPPATGNAKQLLFRIPIQATSSGAVTFTASFDTAAGHKTLLFDPPDELAANQVNYGSVSATVLSTDQPTLGITGGSVAEGNSGQTQLPFTVTLSSAFAQQVTVLYATANGSATAGEDYVATSGTLTFAPGVTSQVVNVPVNGDLKDEADETFSLLLSGPINATLPATPNAVGTITNDNDPKPTVSVTSSVVQDEGNTGTTTYLFTVSLSAASGRVVNVAYATADGTAMVANSDYTATSGTLTFQPGGAPQVVTVLVTGDTTNELNETFSLNLSGPVNADPGTMSGIGTITNDDGPRISFINKTVSNAEGNAGEVDFVFELTSGTADANQVTVVYSTADGTGANAAHAGEDYTGISGTLTFAPDSTAHQFITVKVKGDTINEANENFLVQLSQASNASLVDTEATGTITNDDQITVGFSEGSLAEDTAEGNTGTTNLLFTVTLFGPSQQTVTVGFADQGGTATKADNDYNLSASSLTFAPGETSQVITVAVNGDTKFETDESFSLILSNPTVATLAAGANIAIGTITNDDGQPTVSISAPTATNEGTGATPTSFVFTLTLSSASGVPTVVRYSTADGTATTGDSDYTAVPSGTVTIAANATTATITIPVTADSRDEENETFTVNLGAVDGATVGTSSATATILDDDNPPTVSVSSPTQAEGTLPGTGTTDMVFTVSLSAASSKQITVVFATADGSGANGATSADDYNVAGGTLTFAPGVTSQLVTVQVKADSKNEANETFQLALSSPSNATLGSAGTGTISNDDPVPTIAIGNVAQPEGNSGLTQFVFTVTLSAASGQTVTAAYSTANGTATLANNDYQSASGSITFAPGATSQTVTVNVVGDLFKEGDETFLVNLSSVSNANPTSLQATGTIQDEAGDNIVFTPSSLAGFVYVNANKNQSKDTGEKGFSGATVSLSGTSSFTNIPVTMQLTTASDGSYRFSNLDPGTYTVTFTKPNTYINGAVQTNTAGATSTSNSYTLTIPATGAVTGANNNYGVHDVAPIALSQRNYLASTVRPLTNGATPSAVNATIDSVTPALNAAGTSSADVTGTGQAGASVSLVVSDGTQVKSKGTTTVDANGNWAINDVNLSDLVDGTLNLLATVLASGNGSLGTKAMVKDVAAPTVNSVNRADANPATPGTVHYTVTFSENVSGVDGSDFNLNPTGDVTGASITSVSGSGNIYTVTVNTGTGGGSLGLNLVDNDSVADALGNRLGGTGAANGNFTGQTYTVTPAASSALAGPAVDEAMGGDEDFSPDPTE